MKRLEKLLGLDAASLGWPGLAGLGLLVLIGGFHAFAFAPQRMQLDDLHRESLQMRQRTQLSATAAPQAPAEKLAAFYDYFPRSAELPDLLQRIFGAARRQSLVLEHGEYRTLKDSIGKLTGYRVMLPVHGSYPQIRKFVDDALSEVPALSLDSIQFERRKIGEAAVDAKIRMVVYLRTEP